MKSVHGRGRGWTRVLGLSSLVFVCVALLSSIPLIGEWQVRVADTFFGLAPPPREPSGVVIVSIDDRSLQLYGRWPWSRELLAKLTNNLTQAGAGAIGLDILLSEPQSPEHDLALATAFQAAHRAIIVDKLASLPDGTHWIEPLPEFSQYAAVGHAHAVLDPDSICRRFPPRELTLDGSRWAFAIEVARAVDAPRVSRLLSRYGVEDPGEGSSLTTAKPILARIAFRRDKFDTISAADVLTSFDPAAVRGRPVLVGFGPTEIGDRLSTPLSRELPVPGVEVHAQILNSILTGRMLHETPLWAAALMLFAVSLFAVAVLSRTRGARVVAAVVTVAAGVYALAFIAFVALSRILPVGEMLFAVVIAPLAVYVADSIAVDRAFTRQLEGLRSWLALHGRRFADGENSELSWRLELLQELQTELGSLFELHKALLESTHDPIATFDHDGRLLLTNQAFRKVFKIGNTASLTLAELCAKLIDNPDTAPVCTPDEEQREVYIGDELYAFRTVTLPATTLSPRGGTIVSLTSLRTRVERDRARAEALGFITHELRTPLASIHGFAEMMMRDPASAVSEHAGETIYQETKRLLALISSYLDVLRVDAGAKPLNMHVIDAESLIHQVFDILQPLATPAGMSLVADVPEPITLLGDAPLITGAVLNLVSNAIKYGQPGSDILVRCCRHDQQVIMAVHNTGQPIAESEIPRLFDSYYRAAEVESSKAGWGLGLAFVKRIVEKHGGTIAVLRTSDGTVFEIHLPAGSEHEVTSVTKEAVHEPDSAN